MSFLSRVNLNNLSTNTFHFSPLSTLSSRCLILPVPNIIRDMIQEIWMSSYGIRDHQTGISIVSANIGAIGWIANYQINNRKKFMGPFGRYKTNMERRALSLISLPWRGARGSQPHSVSHSLYQSWIFVARKKFFPDSTHFYPFQWLQVSQCLLV